MHVGKRCPHAPEHILQPLKTRPLARKGNLLHHVLPEELPRSINVSLVQNLFDESTDNVLVVWHLFHSVWSFSYLSRLTTASAAAAQDRTGRRRRQAMLRGCSRSSRRALSVCDGK